MFKRIQVSAAIVISAALVLGCSSSNSSSDNDNDETSMQGPGDQNNGSDVSTFNGNWTIPCEGDFGSFDVVNISINGTSASSDTFSYTDENCTQPDIPAVIATTLSIVYPGGTTTTDRGAATHVNITAETILADGVEPDAAQLAELQTDGAFDTEYDIALIDGTNLFFGEYTNDLDGTTAAKRPTTLDPDFIATRQ